MRVREKIIANLPPAIDHNMRQQHRVFANLDILVDHNIGPHVSIRPNSCTCMHDRCRVNASRIF